MPVDDPLRRPRSAPADPGAGGKPPAGMTTHTRTGSGPCCMVAFDHRGSFARSLSGAGARADCDPARRAELKLTIWQGVAGALGRVGARARPGILIDRGHRRIAAEAEAAGVAVAVALEASGQAVLRAEAPLPALREDLRSLRPGFGKVLVRRNPDEPASSMGGQLRTLRELDELVRAAGARLLVELLIVREPRRAGRRDRRPRPGEQPERRRAELPRLQRAAVEEILAAGVAPALWKLEGHADTEAAGALAGLVGSARPEASILILGAGSEIAGLRRLFSCRAGSERYRGFAVGRTIWQRPISALWQGEISRAEARQAIGDNYLAVIDAFESAARAPTAGPAAARPPAR